MGFAPALDLAGLIRLPPFARSEAKNDGLLSPLKENGKTGHVPNPAAKGLARLAREPEETPVGTGGTLTFVHKGQDQIAPQFRIILVETSKALARDFTISSG